MNVKPILFSGPMVRALLEGRKTQTRRVIKPQPLEGARYSGIHYSSYEPDSYFFNSPGGPLKVRQRVAEGDLLWVRETWNNSIGGDKDISYRATVFDDCRSIWTPEEIAEIRWRRSIHMPRRASRLTLEVTGVRVQRLQEISDEDAQAEGCGATTCANVLIPKDGFPSYRSAFALLWNSLNVSRGFDWDANPWVVAVSFRVHPMNIDEFIALINATAGAA